jgi:steroid 5-alpha reductase family enzyme
MFELRPYLIGLAAMCALAVLTWLVSLAKRDVSIVDSLWSMLILAGAVVYFLSGPRSERAVLTIVAVSIWAARLAIYITARNWGKEEDRRYQAIRKRNEPYFALKSLYIVFLFQALLAWVVSLPLLAAANSHTALTIVDYVGAALTLFGLLFEAIGDWQLAQFKAEPSNRGKVMDRGLWRYTRHPNYFGEACVWWGFYLIALAAGGWWSLLGPLLMTLLLLKVSGVALLEKDLLTRRPEYAAYIEQTNAFFPGPRKHKKA